MHDANKEAERLEHDLAHARTVAMSNGLSVKHRLQALHIQSANVIRLLTQNLTCHSRYQEQVEKVLKLKEHTVRAIIKCSHDIAMFKNEVSRNLADVKDFAESESS